jgi:hypothetical protein
MATSDVLGLRLGEALNDGAKLLEMADRVQFEGVVSKYRFAPWVRWRAANRERWRLFESRKRPI